MAAFDELKEVVVFSADLGNLVGALMDGVGMDDLDELVQAATSVAPAVVGLGAALEALKDLSPEQAQELTETLKERFDIEADRAEEMVEDVTRIFLGGGVFEFVSKWFLDRD